MADTKMIKTVGEHWVCATLARHGWAPALTRDGIARTDILAVGTRIPERPTAEIQVKTASDRGSRTSWPLGGVTQLMAASEHEWFVFALLTKPPQAPRAFVVPRDHVCAATWIVHQNWRTDPSVPEGKRNAGLNQARIELVVWQGYEDRWDVLGTATSSVPVLRPAGSANEQNRAGSACPRGTHGTRCYRHGDQDTSGRNADLQSRVNPCRRIAQSQADTTSPIGATADPVDR